MRKTCKSSSRLLVLCRTTIEVFSECAHKLLVMREWPNLIHAARVAPVYRDNWRIIGRRASGVANLFGDPMCKALPLVGSAYSLWKNNTETCRSLYLQSPYVVRGSWLQAAANDLSPRAWCPRVRKRRQLRPQVHRRQKLVHSEVFFVVETCDSLWVLWQFNEQKLYRIQTPNFVF
jgi:hypothetical protein